MEELLTADDGRASPLSACSGLLSADSQCVHGGEDWMMRGRIRSARSASEHARPGETSPGGAPCWAIGGKPGLHTPSASLSVGLSAESLILSMSSAALSLPLQLLGSIVAVGLSKLTPGAD
ncbi:hypothetical protein EYF80_002326 [Liparis tanakae]|uniref:Uncharacterized protein n=1 Tax=Liparis tanakae TaxID=230148 RepID=A0A4Z2JBL0_9TELE|nr:hypothetical protein EYF80_002326 [Liparis tanakae]